MNNLTFIEFAPKQGAHTMGRYKCFCGNEKITKVSNVKHNYVISCGCKHKEQALKNVALLTKHGMRQRDNTRVEYRAFQGAKYRCTNPNGKGWMDYGGRGIEFRFDNVTEFINHIGFKPNPSLSLDRINNDGHYEIGNVRWATKKEQRCNQRSRKS